MTRPELRMSFANAEALSREFESNLKHGRALLPEPSTLEVLSDCTLVVVHPDDARELALPAQVVMVSASGPVRGVGIELRPFDAGVREQLARFIEGVGAPRPQPTDAGSESAPRSEAADAVPGTVTGAVAQIDADPDPDAKASSETDSDAEAGAEASESNADADRDEHGASTDVQAQEGQLERMRNLSQSERQKLARRGELGERVLLERLYEKEVWGLLLHNPRITIPEIARIARKGSVPRPLLEQIADNNSWIQAPIVRRALLGNPRTTAESIQKLIRATPKHELKLMLKTTSYPIAVRDAARKALKPET